MQALDAQLDLLRNKLEGKIDFEGQELADTYQKQILWTSGAVAFVVGFAMQSLKVLLGVFALGFVICIAVTAPSYPSYNSHPLTWLSPLNKYGLEATTEEIEEEQNRKVVEEKKDR